jgi:hypothetical protein
MLNLPIENGNYSKHNIPKPSGNNSGGFNNDITK